MTNTAKRAAFGLDCIALRFGSQIREARIQAGLSQAQLAGKAG